MRMNFTVPSFKSIPIFTVTSLPPAQAGAAALGVVIIESKKFRPAVLIPAGFRFK
ncbi:MAG: hypothetical protein ACE5NM_12120 [Sedimentisphaerales bacterium]